MRNHFGSNGHKPLPKCNVYKNKLWFASNVTGGHCLTSSNQQQVILPGCSCHRGCVIRLSQRFVYIPVTAQ